MRALVKNDSQTELKSRPFSAFPEMVRKSVGFEEEIKESSMVKIDDYDDDEDFPQFPEVKDQAMDLRSRQQHMFARKSRPQTAKVVFHSPAPVIDSSS